MIIMVAVAVCSSLLSSPAAARPPQHSPMFGHRASSQTVASFCYVSRIDATACVDFAD